MLYTLTLLLHLLTAVLGLGPIVALVVVTSAAPVADKATALHAALGRLTRVATWSTLVLLVTGIGMDLETSRAYDRTWWFRGSTLLVLLLGYLLGRTQRTLRQAQPGSLATVGTLARVMGAVVAVLVALMVLKPG